MNLPVGSVPAGGGLALAPLAQTAGVTCLSHCQWRFEESGTGHGENRDLTGKPGPPSQGRRLPLALTKFPNHVSPTVTSAASLRPGRPPPGGLTESGSL